MFFPEGAVRVHLYGRPVDMRKSFDGLYALAHHDLKLDPTNDHLYVFINRRATQIKVLYWDRTSFCVWAKRPESGCFLSDWSRQPPGEMDESSLFFGASKVPVEIIHVPNQEIAGLAPDQYEVIGEKASHRLAQRPGSYVVLKYVRPLIKRLDTQALSCPPALAGALEGSRADVSFIAGLLLDKFAHHLR